LWIAAFGWAANFPINYSITRLPDYQMTNISEVLWVHGNLECAMISCCAGAELQLRQIPDDSSPDREIVLRELYPSKSDLYERSRLLELKVKADAAERPQQPVPTATIHRD
jgi:hypothetical protein